ncbi:hypothetical protein [Nonomuraea rhizosphaerae]|uniref:hypothetical protein n=1 Tax=Nonomuraea rhizosphaerae TaxID=2665663 RepID=UPI001C5FB4D7|nr:hypothetical protein [Nonomuraea rhizosphaerae]
MPLETRNGPGSSTSQARPDADATTSATNTPIVATGRLIPPDSRRPRWLLAVDRCPLCEQRHTHGAPAGLDTTEVHRLSHCQGGGKPYLVKVAA